MAYFRRHIDEYLLKWKDAPRRKPLLIRGARQVGKSTAVRELGKTFKYFVEINLENFGQFYYYDKEAEDAERCVEIIPLYALSNLNELHLKKSPESDI